MRCAVLGGGMTGLEVADALCAAQCVPEVFELSDKVGVGLAKERRPFLFQRLEQGNWKLHLNSRVIQVVIDSITCETNGETKEYGPYDAVIIALGRKANSNLVNELSVCCPGAEIVALGDAKEPATALEATASAALFAAGWKEQI